MPKRFKLDDKDQFQSFLIRRIGAGKMTHFRGASAVDYLQELSFLMFYHILPMILDFFH